MLLRGQMTRLVILSFKRRIPLKVALEVFETATAIPSLSLHELEFEFISIKIRRLFYLQIFTARLRLKLSKKVRNLVLPPVSTAVAN
ncbi:unnamed protein product [Larinioides sclopetarius]|uniref:Uncharacterized protein n=1 Tax=Larinioides sclopetarius TaxID=280406 RepID=A0AAV2A9A8_9ARAC